jgi:subtilisin family serine protease
LAGAGLVPASADDHGNPSAKTRIKTTSVRKGRKPVTDNQDHLVVRMAKAGGGADEDAVAASVGGRRGSRVRPGVFRVDVAKGQGADAARRLRENPSVSAVEDDVRFTSAEVAPADAPALVPSDEPAGSAAGAAPPPVNERCFAGCALTFDGGSTSRIYSQSDFMHIGVIDAWAVTHGDPNTLVAVVDTDVDATHPDLAGKVIVGPNFTCATDAPRDAKTECQPDNVPDPEGHGTAVAGIIAATPNNGVGIAGLGWDTKVLSVRVLDHQGGGLSSDIAAGIRYAADYPGVKIINLSLQQEPCKPEDTTCTNAKSSPTLEEAIKYAQSKGKLVVSAAGNQWDTTPSYPAAYEGVLSVTAVDTSDNDNVAKFARHGPWVDIAAPGVGVLTLATPCSDGNCWVTPDGTSFATPIVSATAALVWAKNPGMTAQQVAARLMSTAQSVPGTGVDFASGEINVGRAVAGATAGPLQAIPGAAQISATSTPIGPTGKGYWLAASDGGIFSYGNATFLGSTGAIALNKPIVGMAATPSGKGYWMVASDGGIFAFGDAAFFGSTGNIHLNKPIVGMAVTRTGHGYWMVASDGGIFAFGDAPFFGSTGNLRLNRSIVDLAPSPDGDGYWMVASDGGVFAFGGSAFYGSPTGTAGGNVIGLAPTPTGDGYWIVGSDGSVYNFGGAQYFGGLGGVPLNRPIVGVAIR